MLMKLSGGGAGYAISSSCGVEVYDKEKDKPLPYEIEHIYPDYDLYGIKDTAYGYITRGCRNDCSFCHVPKMFCGKVFHRVANLNEFWHGQKNIVLLDPNIFACEDWKEIFQELIDSKANVDFSQGLDIRLLDDEKLEMLKRIKFKTVHFAWDNYEDGNFIMPKFEWLKEKTGWGKTKVTVYILCNYNSTHEQDYERCLYIRELRFQPYVMIYDKKNVKRGSEINKLARWCNWSPYCWGFDTYEEFKKVMYKS